MRGRPRQSLGGGPHDARQVAGGVDHGVPAAAAERLEATVAVSEQVLGVRKQPGVRPAAMEQRDVMAARARRLDQVAPQEQRSAEEEEAHPLGLLYRAEH